MENDDNRAETSDLFDAGGSDGDLSSSNEDGEMDSSVTPSGRVQRRGRVVDGGEGGSIAESLRGVLQGESDGGDGEQGLLQWLKALDMQVLGACRADERLNPMLKLNVSSGAAEDRLLAQLSQHFEASEIGMLARCLCVPLVSIRVGKVNKQGNLLCPTAVRGHLNLNLLPSSNMRLTFTGDDGCTERLAVVTNDSDSSDVKIEEIEADASGRSFLLKLPGSGVLYYWCSEKSKLHGMELIAKMKDLLHSKPSLSCLTGISASRLESFATHLRVHLIGCSSTMVKSTSSNGFVSCSYANEIDSQSPFIVSKTPTSLSAATHTGKVHSLCQGSLSPRLNSFKDGLPRTLPNIRSGARDKLKRHVDNHLRSLTICSKMINSVSTSFTGAASTSKNDDGNLRGPGSSSALPLCLPDIPSVSSPLFAFTPTSGHLPSSQLSVLSSEFSPYYCWCPPCPSSLHHNVMPLHLPSASSDSLPLPPLSSLLSPAGSTASPMPSKLPINFDELQALTLPSLVPDPLVSVPLSVSSIALPSTQQIPTFTPFMADPIVHIPVIDVCSSGQGYLVSGGPAISSVISPLLPGHVNPFISKAESAAEKHARETLKILMASAPTISSPQSANAVPVILDNVGEKFSYANVSKHADVAVASCPLFAGALYFDAVASGFSSIGELNSLEKGVHEVGNSKRSKTKESNKEFDYDDPTKNREL